MKNKSKLLSLVLALALCFGLAVPAFAADTPHDMDAVSSTATWKEFGDRLLDDCKLTINGVIGQEPFQREGFFDSVIFDVVAGGGYTLDMSYPAGRWRYYNTYMDMVLLNSEPSEGVAPYLSEIPYNYADTNNPQKQYVFTCTDSMVSKPGAELLFHVWLDWGDGEPDSDYTTYDGNVQFWLRVNPAQSAESTQPTNPTQPTTPTRPTAPNFSDVPSGAYYAKPVAWAVEQGITTGTTNTKFSPGSPCTTAHILTFLWRAAGRPGAASANMAWTDELAVITNWAKSKGMTVPGSLNTTCTRASAVTYMWKAAGSPAPKSSASFTDVSVSADYAKAVSWAVENGITEGTGNGAFSPSQGCNRGQIVTFLYRQYVEPLTPSTPATPSTSSTSDMTAEQMCAKVVELVNQERAKAGLKPLSTTANLTAAANIRAPELVTKFSHDRPDGSSCVTALKEANVTGYWTAGENIAAGQRTPEEVMDSWMNSPGHRGNILDPNFTHIGVGYCNGCWVQMFIGVW